LLTSAAQVKMPARFDSFKESFVTPDKQGVFQVEVPRGNSWCWISEQGHRKVENRGIYVLPGDVIDIGTLKEVPPPPAETPASDKPEHADERVEHPKVTWVEGTVRDTTGKPVQGAKVYAFAIYYGGIRNYGMVEEAVADENGRYKITGEGNLSMFSATLVAHASGKCPTWGWLNQPTEDFVLSDQGGTLEVEVLQNDKPAAHVPVGVWIEGASVREQWAHGGEPYDYQMLYPIEETDDQGIARFEKLMPGRYQIYANEGKHRSILGLRERLSGWGAGPQCHGAAIGVPVKNGMFTKHRLAIYAHAHAYSAEERITVLPPSGDRPIDPKRLSINSSHQASGTKCWSGSTIFNEFGGVSGSETAGLHRITFRYRESLGEVGDLTSPPYCEASIFVAVSPSLGSQKPVRLTATDVVPAKVTVKLADAAGRPLRGTVELNRAGDHFDMIGSTDARGSVSFEGVYPWQLRILGFADGFCLPGRGCEDEPLPKRIALRPDIPVLLPEPITPQPNTDTAITLRVQPVGYVCGKLKAPSGEELGQFRLGVDDDASTHGARCDYDPKTGDFVAGPFRPGKTSLTLFDWRYGEIGTEDVIIKGGKVTEIELHPAAGSIGGLGLLIGGSDDGTHLARTGLAGSSVTMADGKTPATGAMIYLIHPGAWQPTMAGIADPAGKIRVHGCSGYVDREWRDPPGSPKAAVIVALLPGTCGASIVSPTPNKPLKIVLPAARGVKGHVTMAGTAPASRSARFRVLAAYQGKGKLDAMLSVETTADADGRFALVGLTPGTYQLQAAMDDLWLSETRTLVVGSEELADVNLDIGSPGGAIAVVLTDASGSPLRNHRVMLDRPTGPLAIRCWPAEWQSDGAGRVYVPTLEVGKHRLHVKGDSSIYEINVPPLPTDVVREVRIETHCSKK
jgi:protocatechuate 3,4-dioxygenase beta subunit